MCDCVAVWLCGCVAVVVRRSPLRRPVSWQLRSTATAVDQLWLADGKGGRAFIADLCVYTRNRAMRLYLSRKLGKEAHLRTVSGLPGSVLLSSAHEGSVPAAANSAVDTSGAGEAGAARSLWAPSPGLAAVAETDTLVREMLVETARSQLPVLHKNRFDRDMWLASLVHGFWPPLPPVAAPTPPSQLPSAPEDDAAVSVDDASHCKGSGQVRHRDQCDQRDPVTTANAAADTRPTSSTPSTLPRNDGTVVAAGTPTAQGECIDLAGAFRRWQALPGVPSPVALLPDVDLPDGAYRVGVAGLRPPATTGGTPGAALPGVGTGGRGRLRRPKGSWRSGGGFDACPLPAVQRFVEGLATRGGVVGCIRSWRACECAPVPATAAASASAACGGDKGQGQGAPQHGTAAIASITFTIGRNRWCANVGRPHRSNHINLVADLRYGHVYQVRKPRGECHVSECVCVCVCGRVCIAAAAYITGCGCGRADVHGPSVSCHWLPVQRGATTTARAGGTATNAAGSPRRASAQGTGLWSRDTPPAAMIVSPRSFR